MNVFSEDEASGEWVPVAVMLLLCTSGSLVMEGRVVQRADIQPMATDKSLDMYMKLKK